MGIVRNCIDIIGITPESELLKQINGQLKEISKTENLFINEDIQIKNIYQIIIDTDIKGKRIINTPTNKIAVIDGYKKFKIAYYDIYANMGILELTSPYNFFFDIENNENEIQKVDIYIADAYFELMNKKVLYCNILYIVNVQYHENVKKIQEINAIKQYSSDSVNKVIKNDPYNEISISKYDKKYFEEEQNINLEGKNKLIDIDAEYL